MLEQGHEAEKHRVLMGAVCSSEICHTCVKTLQTLKVSARKAQQHENSPLSLCLLVCVASPAKVGSADRTGSFCPWAGGGIELLLIEAPGSDRLAQLAHFSAKLQRVLIIFCRLECWWVSCDKTSLKCW